MYLMVLWKFSFPLFNSKDTRFSSDAERNCKESRNLMFPIWIWRNRSAFNGIIFTSSYVVFVPLALVFWTYCFAKCLIRKWLSYLDPLWNITGRKYFWSLPFSAWAADCSCSMLEIGSDMAMVTNLKILMCERGLTIVTCGCPSMSCQVVVSHGRHGGLLRKNFADFITFTDNMIIEMCHDIRSAVQCGLCLMFRDVCHTMTAKTTDFMFIHDVTLCICICMGLIDLRYQEWFKITDQI